MEYSYDIDFMEGKKEFWKSDIGFFLKLSQDERVVYLALIKDPEEKEGVTLLAREPSNHGPFVLLRSFVNDETDSIQRTLLALEIMDLMYFIHEDENTDMMREVITFWVKNTHLEKVTFTSKVKIKSFEDLYQAVELAGIQCPTISSSGSLVVH